MLSELQANADEANAAYVAALETEISNVVRQATNGVAAVAFEVDEMACIYVAWVDEPGANHQNTRIDADEGDLRHIDGDLYDKVDRALREDENITMYALQSAAASFFQSDVAETYVVEIDVDVETGPPARQVISYLLLQDSFVDYRHLADELDWMSTDLFGDDYEEDNVPAGDMFAACLEGLRDHTLSNCEDVAQKYRDQNHEAYVDARERDSAMQDAVERFRANMEHHVAAVWQHDPDKVNDEAGPLTGDLRKRAAKAVKVLTDLTPAQAHNVVDGTQVCSSADVQRVLDSYRRRHADAKAVYILLRGLYDGDDIATTRMGGTIDILNGSGSHRVVVSDTDWSVAAVNGNDVDLCEQATHIDPLSVARRILALL